MKTAQIQALHPDPEKTNKRIDANKYELIKKTILSVLEKNEPTHTGLMEKMNARLEGKFDGNISWYTETVKLDLEARKIIARSNTKPATYHLVQK